MNITIPDNETRIFSGHQLENKVKFINIQDNNLWCRPCSQNGSFPCYRTKQYCMSNITPKEVIENVEKILA